MDITKKRRQPLKETSGNIPSPKKRFKHDGAENDISHGGVKSGDDVLHSQSQSRQNRLLLGKPSLKLDSAKTKQNRLVGDELLEWRHNWKKIMKTSVVYFDTQSFDNHNPTHVLEQKRAHRGLKYVGSLVVPFYDRDVTIIVTRRPFNPETRYPSNDIFHSVAELKIKVWNFDKVFRFLKNLGVDELEYLNTPAYENGDLSNLLKEEKVFGSTDKDPNAKRDDLHYLDHNYIYVYDLLQQVRPIAVRQWNDNNFPGFYFTLDGKCPFLPDSENLERKIARRNRKFQETANYRQLLKTMAYELVTKPRNRRISSSSFFNSTLTDNDNAPDNNSNNNENQNVHNLPENSDNDSTISQGSNGPTDVDNIQFNEVPESNRFPQLDHESESFKHPQPALLRGSSCIPTNNSNGRFYDVAASGFNGTSNAIQMSIDSGSFHGGNGLGPTMSQVPSKNINNLKKRIFMKKQKQSLGADSTDRDLKPGYCENCRIKYDHFDDHIKTSRHRRFALDDTNFKEIDNLINTLNENKVFGLITSDGDYSFHD